MGHGRAAKMEYEVQAESNIHFAVGMRTTGDIPRSSVAVRMRPHCITRKLRAHHRRQPALDGRRAEYEHYSADVTRTFPVNGKFSKEQADIYQIVYNAQEAAAKVAKPGVTMETLSEAANAVIVDGLSSSVLLRIRTPANIGSGTCTVLAIGSE